MNTPIRGDTPAPRKAVKHRRTRPIGFASIAGWAELGLAGAAKEPVCGAFRRGLPRPVQQSGH